MIEIEEKDGSLYILLPSESTIVDVEADANRVRALLSGGGRFEKVVVDAGKVERIDTAYLQLLLSAAASVHGADIKFALRPGSPAVQQLFKLYGLSLNLWDGGEV